MMRGLLFVKAPEETSTGIWVYQFYDAALFMVNHSKVPWSECRKRTELL